MLIVRSFLLSLLFAITTLAGTIRVGAAISLKEALTETAQKYESATGEKVELSFGSSGQVAAQVKAGAEMDVFISAANKQVEELSKEKLVDPASRRVIAANTLVMIVPADAKDAPKRFEDLGGADVVKIAVGAPRTVPAGQYAEQVFRALKLTDAVAPKLVYGTNVRQVLTYVERGEVSAGVVYGTDAKESGDKVRVVATADEKTHEPIVYPAVIVTGSKHVDDARRFLTYLAGDDARDILRAKGFTPPAAEK